MTQASGPKSNSLFTDDQWQLLNEDESGIVLDYDGTAYALTMPTSSNDATIGSTTQTSAAVVAGREHHIAAGGTQVVTIPDAVGGTQVSVVMLRFDPAWATSDPGPVRAVVVTGAAGAGAPTTDQTYPGVVELPLYQITRAVGQSLSAIPPNGIRDLRRRRSVAIQVTALEDLPLSPIGTAAFLPDGTGYVRTVRPGTLVVAWVPVAIGNPQSVASYGSLWRPPTAQPGAQIRLVKSGRQVTLMAGAFENRITLSPSPGQDSWLPATGQNPAALTIPSECAPEGKVIVPAYITIAGVSNIPGALWFLPDGTVTFQTSAAISSAPAGTISVAVGGATWVTP